jgi:hypothetical protein
VTSALAVVTIAVGTAVALPALRTPVNDRTIEAGPETVAPKPATRKVPAPRVVGNTVVAGSVRMPIPKGWKVGPAGRTGACWTPPGTITIERPAPGPCPSVYMSFMSVKDTELRAPGYGIPSVTFDGLQHFDTMAPASITLPGGEPGWMNQPFGTRMPVTEYDIVLPWSKVEIIVHAGDQGSRNLVGMLRSTDPVGAGPLALPAGAAHAELATSNDFDKVIYGTLDDRVKIDAVLRFLRGRKDTVSNEEACASFTQDNIGITTYSMGDVGTGPVPNEYYSTSVVIAVGEKCQEATSSFGGRVRLSDADVAEILSLFGKKK